MAATPPTKPPRMPTVPGSDDGDWVPSRSLKPKHRRARDSDVIPRAEFCPFMYYCDVVTCDLLHWPTKRCREDIDGKCDRYERRSCTFLHAEQEQYQRGDGIVRAGLATLPGRGANPTRWKQAQWL